MVKLTDVIHEEINSGRKRGFFRTCAALWLSASKSVILSFRLAAILHHKGFRLAALWMKKRLAKSYGMHISSTARIGLGIRFPHPTGIVIGDGVSIGREAIIFQQVTLGGQRLGDGKKGNYPVVGNNVTIFAGAKILGAVTIGDGATIGANAVVLTDVEANSVYAGIPAKRIR